MRAGQLREYIKLEQDASNAGDEVPSFTGTSWDENIPAEVIDTAGGEMVRGRQIDAEIDCVVTIRYRSGVNHSMRIQTSAGRTLNIRKVLDKDGRRRFLELHCSEAQN